MTAPPPPGLASRDFRLLLIAQFGAFTNYAPLLSVAPLWAAEGGASPGGVGAVTAVTMAATVATQLSMPVLLRLLRLRQMLVIGALLLGPPTAAYAITAELAPVLAISVVRGVGFALVVVAGSALVAELVPAHERGRAVGWYGVAVGLPSAILLPVGVWVAGHVGFTPVFVTVALLATLAAPLALLIRPGPDASEPEPPAADRRSPGVRTIRPLLASFSLLLTAACALGGAMSFIPLALTAPGLAPWTLFALSAGMTLGRWLAGVHSDRAAAVGGLLPLSVTGCAVGMAGLALALGLDAGAALTLLAVTAAAAYGLGFGALQNDTLVVMFQRAGRGGSGTASTVWNMAYDAGTGVGSLAIGFVAELTGLDWAFLLAGLVIAGVLPVAIRETRTLRAQVARAGTA